VFWYRAFGQVLASDVEFPELHPAQPVEPAWTVRQVDASFRCTHATDLLLGVDPLYGQFSARLTRTDLGWVIVVEDTGEFRISPDGRTIEAYRYPQGNPDFFRAHLLGRVIATSMHFAGLLVLHGSAVSYPGGSIAFLAPKNSGKSTLALTLTMAGARLVTDDSVPVSIADKPLLWPGIHSMRLRGDSAGRLPELPSTQRADGKYVLSDLPAERLEEERTPLRAIYLLLPAESIASGAVVDRRRLPQPLAAAALVGQSKIPRMLGAAEGAELLRRAARVASRIPVYQLPLVRDLARLPEVATQIREWHADTPS
jgi:hypothetical protein